MQLDILPLHELTVMAIQPLCVINRYEDIDGVQSRQTAGSLAGKSLSIFLETLQQAIA